jgi:acetyltransferase
MLETLRSWPLLQDALRHRQAGADRLIETLSRFSYLVADFPQIKEIEVNPLVVTPDGVLALDAQVRLDRNPSAQPTRPDPHLAIRPYPGQYRRVVELKDGTSVVLRPIRPEDEPLWHGLLSSCSSETLFQRFQCVFTRTHEMAARFCFIDYDREIAILAEIEDHGGRRLVGVGRLVADPDHEEAEYAALVTDAFQGKGLGSLLTDYCIEIAESWGVKRLTAITTPDNAPVVNMMRKRGFQIRQDFQERTVAANKELAATLVSRQQPS